MRLDRQLPTEIDANDPIFAQSYRQPLKSLLHHLSTLKMTSDDGLILRFTKYSLEIRPAEISTTSHHQFDRIKSVWRSLFEPVEIENPIYPPLDSFPVSICGISSDWFHFLLDAVGTSSLIAKSTLILCVNPNGLKLILPGNNRAEIDVATFNFTSMTCTSDSGITLMVSLREMSALMNLARKLNSLIDLNFGPPGQYPLVAVLHTIGAFECKFVMATIPSTEQEVNVEEDVEDHISGTEDELSESE